MASGDQANEADTTVPTLEESMASPAGQVLLNKLHHPTPEVTTEIMEKYREIVSNPDTLDEAANYLYKQIVDDHTMQIFLEEHHVQKVMLATEAPSTSKQSNENRECYQIIDSPDTDIFGNPLNKKPIFPPIECPNCKRMVGTTRFTVHLAHCTGIVQRRSTRQVNCEISQPLERKLRKVETEKPLEHQAKSRGRRKNVSKKKNAAKPKKSLKRTKRAAVKRNGKGVKKTVKKVCKVRRSKRLRQKSVRK